MDSRKISFDSAMTERNLQQLHGLHDKLLDVLAAFEGGGSAFPSETGFFHLPSGRPMKVAAVKRRFLKIASIACEAAAKASEYSERATRPSSTDTEPKR